MDTKYYLVWSSDMMRATANLKTMKILFQVNINICLAKT